MSQATYIVVNNTAFVVDQPNGVPYVCQTYADYNSQLSGSLKLGVDWDSATEIAWEDMDEEDVEEVAVICKYLNDLAKIQASSKHVL